MRLLPRRASSLLYGLSPPLKNKIYYGVVVVAWGQVVKARHPSSVFSTQVDSGLYKLSPIPKRGAGWKTPTSQPSSSAPRLIWGFTRRPRPIYRPCSDFPPMIIFRVLHDQTLD